MILGVVVFFFKQKTAYEMRISDWSSDVCSSDLANFDDTLSHQGAPPGPPSISAISLRRKDSSTAFLSHWLTCHAPPASRAATRRLPSSSPASAASTASRTGPRVVTPSVSRASQADRKSTRLNSSH